MGIDQTVVAPKPSEHAHERLIVVANRLPVEQRPDGTIVRSPGGLASALAAVAGDDTEWIGWSGIVGPLAEPLDDPALHVIELDQREVDRYYDGFANSLLWPLFHGRLRQPRVTRTWWRTYEAVNERFAERAAEVAAEGATVWIHDYHLLLVPAMLRRRRPDLRIGLFLHIPFPPSDLFATLPWRGDLVRGMSAADLLGFQTPHDADNARQAFKRFARDRRKTTRIDRIGDAQIGDFPISVDVDDWVDLGVRANAAAQHHREQLGVEYLYVGVDRLDYTKGIDQRLRAFGELLADGALDPRTTGFVQVSVPTRAQVSDYDDERHEIEQLVAEINARHHRDDGSSPVLHLTVNLDTVDVAAWYWAADCLVVTSYADGMNLVAKEFAATRTDLGATVVLSEFAGAANDLPGALIVNPYDTDAVKLAMLEARQMSPTVVTERMRSMRESVTAHDVHAWAADFLGRLRRTGLHSVDLAGGGR